MTEISGVVSEIFSVVIVGLKDEVTGVLIIVIKVSDEPGLVMMSPGVVETDG